MPLLSTHFVDKVYHIGLTRLTRKLVLYIVP